MQLVFLSLHNSTDQRFLFILIFLTKSFRLFLRQKTLIQQNHNHRVSENERLRVMFRAVNSKWFDMAHLEREAVNYGVDSLYYWDELVAIVSPRGYQDTVYQNRLLAMKRADQALRFSIGNDSKSDDSLKAELHEVEIRNEAELKQLIEERGFPTLTRVGSLCNDYATYIAQYMSKEFNQWYFKEALAAIDNGDYNNRKLYR